MNTNKIISNNDPISTQNTEETSVYSGMNEVFEVTKKIIDTMQQGERIAVKDLADKVNAGLNGSGKNVSALVQMFVKKYPAVSVEVGRNGGVYKGGKPKRVDNRPRCHTCNQVIKSTEASKSTNVDTMLQA